MQLNIDFNPVHHFENNSQSQEKLNLRREDFNDQCWLALKRMLDGDRITNKDEQIGHIARRAKDLIDGFKIPVQREWALNEKGEKEKWKWYFIREEDRPKVMRRIIDLMN